MGAANCGSDVEFYAGHRGVVCVEVQGQAVTARWHSTLRRICPGTIFALLIVSNHSHSQLRPPLKTPYLFLLPLSPPFFFPPCSNSRCPTFCARLFSVFAVSPAECFCMVVLDFSVRMAKRGVQSGLRFFEKLRHKEENSRGKKRKGFKD